MKRSEEKAVCVSRLAALRDKNLPLRCSRSVLAIGLWIFVNAGQRSSFER